MVNTALVTGHTEWDNLLLSFRATVHTHTLTQGHARTHTPISFHTGCLRGPYSRSGPVRERAARASVRTFFSFLGGQVVGVVVRGGGVG